MAFREEYLETPLLLPPSLYGRSLARSYANVITKFSPLDGLPIFLTHDASLARFRYDSFCLIWNLLAFASNEQLDYELEISMR